MSILDTSFACYSYALSSEIILFYCDLFEKEALVIYSVQQNYRSSSTKQNITWLSEFQDFRGDILQRLSYICYVFTSILSYICTVFTWHIL